MIRLKNIAARSGKKAVKVFLMIRDNFPAQFFLPNLPQAQFAKAVGQLPPDKRIFLVTSGNGTGKSTIAINILLNIIYGNINLYRNVKDLDTGEVYSGFFDYPLYNDFPKEWPHNVWYVSNNESLKAIAKEWKNWANPNDYRIHKDGKSSIPISRITFDSNDWEISFKTIDQDPETFESANVSIIIFDEPPPQKLFKAAVSRLRTGGIILIPATPLFGAGWFVDDIINRIDEDGDKWHQTVSVYENCIEDAGEWDCGRWGIQKKGNLRKENIEFTLRNYDPDELEARRDGVFKYLTGVVYKMYNREELFMDLPPVDYPYQFMYRIIIDPHDRRPPAVIWIRFDNYGRRSVIREWPSRKDPQFGGLPFHKIKSADPYTIKDFVRFWIEIEEELGIPNDRIVCIMDPNFGKKPNRKTGKMVWEEYRAEFRRQGRPRRIIVEEVIDDLATGHKAVKDLLRPTSDGDYPLLIDKSCYNVDYGLRNYSYDDPRGKAAEKIDVSEKVMEKAKDFPDLLRYDAVVPFHWKPIKLRPKDPYETDDYDLIKAKFQKIIQKKIMQRPKEAI